MLSASQSDICPAFIIKEPDVSVVVRSDSRKYHIVQFSTLPAIYGSDILLKVKVL